MKASSGTTSWILLAFVRFAERTHASRLVCDGTGETLMKFGREPRSKSALVAFIMIWFRLTLATSITLLPNAAPSMTQLSTSAFPTTATSATSALRLKCAAHFVAIDGARKSQSHGPSLYLHAKRHVVSSNASSHRGRPARVLKRAAQF